MKTIMPNYNESIVNLACSISKHFEIDYKHNTLDYIDKILDDNNYKNIVLILYDGFGYNLLKRNINITKFLNDHLYKSISSVFPATTTAATTSITTALNPCEHGWLGWNVYFKKIDKIVTVYFNRIKDSDVIAEKFDVARTFLPYETIMDRINKQGKYNAYHLASYGDCPYKDIDDMNNKIITLCKEDGKKYIYAYYSDPDYTMHEHGTDGLESVKSIKNINTKTKNLCKHLKDTLILVVADHGHLNTRYEKLTDYPDIIETLKRKVSLDSRAIAFYVKRGMFKQFEKAFEAFNNEKFILLTKKEVIKQKIFGDGKQHKLFNDEIGDYLAIAIDDVTIRHDDDGHVFKSSHSGITEDEMLVPLIIIDKK